VELLEGVCSLNNNSMLKKKGDRISAWPEIKELCLEYEKASVVPPLVCLLDMYEQDGNGAEAVSMAEKLRVVDFTRERYWRFKSSKLKE
jgi:hypothetical protein